MTLSRACHRQGRRCRLHWWRLRWRRLAQGPGTWDFLPIPNRLLVGWLQATHQPHSREETAQPVVTSPPGLIVVHLHGNERTSEQLEEAASRHFPVHEPCSALGDLPEVFRAQLECRPEEVQLRVQLQRNEVPHNAVDTKPLKLQFRHRPKFGGRAPLLRALP